MNWNYIKHKRPVFKLILMIPGAKEALRWLEQEYLITDKFGRRYVTREEIEFMRDNLPTFDDESITKPVEDRQDDERVSSNGKAPA